MGGKIEENAGFHRVEKHIGGGGGKEENAGYQYFLHFPTMFLKDLFLLVIKTKDRLVKGEVRQFRFNPFPNKPWFLRVCSTSLLKTLLEKEKLLVMGNFSFSHSVFNPFEELSSIFIKFEIVVCKVFEFGSV